MLKGAMKIDCAGNSNLASPGGTLFRFAGARLTLIAAAASLMACGSGSQEGEEPFESESTSAIIGGSAVSVATRRSLGLVQTANGCSGSLITPHWVMTANHCLDALSPSNNQFSIPRADGTLETRVGQVISRVGTSDIALVNLAPSNNAPQWPSLSRSMLRNPTPSQLVGQSVTCYGRGATAYASPSGLTGAGVWKSLTKQVARRSGGSLFIDAVNGDQIPATGDSGGACLFGNQTAGVMATATNFTCANNTTPATCDATVTRINTVAIESTAPYADYIDFAGSRAAATFIPLTLNTGWSNAALGDNVAGYSAFDSTVHLRGAISAPANSNLAFAFTLPSSATPPVNIFVPVTLCDAGKGRLLIETNGRVNVVVEGGDWTKAQCMVSLEGVSFLSSSFGVPALTLQNGWTTTIYGTRAPAARVNAGVVRLEGAMSGGASSFAFNLPANLRPAQNVYLPIDLCAARKGRLLIQPTGDAFVSAEGVFSDAQCFTSLEGATYVLAQQSPVTLLNGWSVYGGTRSPAAINVGGIVRLQGAIRSGTTGDIFQLPAAMRPATLVYIPVDLCNAAKGRVMVGTNGTVSLSSVPGNFSAAQCFTSLEGAWFGI
jgi:hypothetical protein